MNFLTIIFNQLFYQPLFNALIFIYRIVPGNDLGIAVLILTILIKILLYPLNLKGIESQKKLSDLQPKLKEIRERFKNDKEMMTKETLELYQKEKINPFSGFFLILIQLPVLFALYKVFADSIFSNDFSGLYSFVPNPGEIKPQFLMINLAKPDFILAFAAGVLQFFQAKTQTPAKQDFNIKAKSKDFPDFSEVLNKQMLYFFPVLTFFILLKIPSAISLYLVASTGFSILQRYIVLNPKK